MNLTMLGLRLLLELLLPILCDLSKSLTDNSISRCSFGKTIDVHSDLLAKCKTNIDKVKTDTTLLYAENTPKDSYNSTNLAKMPYPLLEIKAIDKFHADIPQT